MGFFFSMLIVCTEVTVGHSVCFCHTVLHYKRWTTYFITRRFRTGRVMQRASYFSHRMSDILSKQTASRSPKEASQSFLLFMIFLLNGPFPTLSLEPGVCFSARVPGCKGNGRTPTPLFLTLIFPSV